MSDARVGELGLELAERSRKAASPVEVESA
jgi:hypothetical protein